MLTCSAPNCAIQGTKELAVIDNGQRRVLLCGRHQLQYASGHLEINELDGYPSGLGEHECEICSSPAAMFADEVELYLCERHLLKLLQRNLGPIEYDLLLLKHGEFGLIDPDFYARGGYALQPLAFNELLR